MHPIAGRTLFGLKEWFLFVEHSGLYARNLSRSEGRTPSFLVGG